MPRRHLTAGGAKAVGQAPAEKLETQCCAFLAQTTQRFLECLRTHRRQLLPRSALRALNAKTCEEISAGAQEKLLRSVRPRILAATSGIWLCAIVSPHAHRSASIRAKKQCPHAAPQLAASGQTTRAHSLAAARRKKHGAASFAQPAREEAGLLPSFLPNKKIPSSI